MRPFPEAAGFELLTGAGSNLSPDVFCGLEAEVVLTVSCTIDALCPLHFFLKAKLI